MGMVFFYYCVDCIFLAFKCIVYEIIYCLEFEGWSIDVY